jgi:hypothetical protein
MYALLIDFQNMRGITSKIIEFNQHLQQNKTDIFGVVESFLSSDDKPPRLDKSYRWVGKCRKNGLKKGGVGLFIRSITLWTFRSGAAY